jgi:hypothetical protein
MKHPCRLRSGVTAVAVLASAGLAVSAANAADDVVSVVAFNVESDGSSDFVIGEQLAASHDIDLWILTEVWDHKWPGRLAEAAGRADGMPYERVLGKTGRENRIMLLYRPDRLRLIETAELTDMPHGKREAAPLSAGFEGPGGDSFDVVAVHFSKNSKRRVEQAQALNAWAADRDRPALAAGTFFFDLPIGDPPGSVEAIAAMTAADHWRWLAPDEVVPTQCGRGERLDDFVFVSGTAESWTAESEIMFRQPNYCRENDRTSTFRPTFARFSPRGGALDRGAVPERPVSPLLPGVVFVRDTDDDGEVDARAEPQGTSGAVPGQEAGAAPGPGPAAPAAAAPAIVSGDEDEDDADREALEKRLEALEREAAELRKALEEEPGPEP